MLFGGCSMAQRCRETRQYFESPESAESPGSGPAEFGPRRQHRTLAGSAARRFLPTTAKQVAAFPKDHFSFRSKSLTMRAQRQHDPKQSVFLFGLDTFGVDIGFEKNFTFERSVIDLQRE